MGTSALTVTLQLTKLSKTLQVKTNDQSQLHKNINDKEKEKSIKNLV